MKEFDLIGTRGGTLAAGTKVTVDSPALGAWHPSGRLAYEYHDRGNALEATTTARKHVG